MTEERALTTREPSYLMPAMALAEAIERRNMVVQFVSAIMVEERDYGKVPGSDKPTLLKPGAEKLTTFFGLTPRFQVIEKVEDWTGAEHGGEPFFYYWFRCQLWRGDRLVAEGDGSCNSWESKYRYRQGQHICPTCGKPAVFRDKKKPGGWYCWDKKGGCGAQFPPRSEGAQRIEEQQVGRVLNPDPADVANTVNKMGQKRSYIAATLPAVNASEFFTQDLEDLNLTDEPTTPTARPEPAKTKTVIVEDGKGNGPDAIVVTVKPEPAKPNGKGAAIANNAGTVWNQVGTKLAAEEPYYQDKDGKPDWYHLTGAAKKLGYDIITVDNIRDVDAALHAHATASKKQQEEQAAA